MRHIIPSHHRTANGKYLRGEASLRRTDSLALFCAWRRTHRRFSATPSRWYDCQCVMPWLPALSSRSKRLLQRGTRPAHHAFHVVPPCEVRGHLAAATRPPLPRPCLSAPRPCSAPCQLPLDSSAESASIPVEVGGGRRKCAATWMGRLGWEPCRQVRSRPARGRRSCPAVPRPRTG